MADGEPAGREMLRDLGDGLVLRRARPEDCEQLSLFHANTLLDADEIGPADRLFLDS